MTATPTVFTMQSILASAADTLSNAVTSEMGAAASGEFVVRTMEPSPPADAFDDEVTTIFTPTADNPLPPSVAHSLISGMSGVSVQDTDRLRSWMRDRGLRSSSWINASQ